MTTPADEHAYNPVRRGALAAMLAGGGAAVAAAVAAPPPPAAAAPKFVDKSNVPVNVRDHGAKGDGSTDDSTAFQKAITEAGNSGRSVYVPAGRYKVTAPWRAEGVVTIRGEGMWHTTIAVAAHAAFADMGSHPHTLTIEDIAFDNLGNDQSALELDGDRVRRFTFRRCRFTNMGGPNGALAAVEFTSVGVGEFTDCLWHNPREYAGQGTAVRLRGPAEGGGHELRFTGNNRFLWVNNAIRTHPHVWQNADNAENAPMVLQRLHIEGAYFDGFWWLIPASHEGEGSGVTYSDTSLTDSAANFDDVDANARPNIAIVRAMPVRHQGTVTESSSTKLTDTAANYLTAGVRRMDIVRCDDRWSVVAIHPWSEENPGTVQVEEWYDNETLLPTGPPAPGTPYTIYGVIYGAATEASGSAMVIEPWINLYGELETPADGTRYEVAAIRPTYLLFNGPGGVENLTIMGSTFRRGWADLAGARPYSSQIIGNLWEDGQESGCVITSSGPGHLVIGNNFRHIGNAPFYLDGSESVVTANRAENCRWRGVASERGADFGIRNGRRNQITHNISIGGIETQTPVACVGLQATGNVGQEPWKNDTRDDNLILHNRRYGDDGDAFDVRISGQGWQNNEIIGAGEVRYVGGGAAQLMETRGSGSPEGRVAATPGSTYRDVDGGSAATLYVKESGSGDTGWVAK